jgi:hypothetical protein
MSKVLTIVTPTMHGRKVWLDRMLEVLQPQLEANLETVEHFILLDGGEMSLGKKMNLLYGMAQGKYIAVVNDDDVLPDYYISTILKAAESDADILLGKISQYWTSGMRLPEDYPDNGEVINRYENVIPVKTSLMQEYGIWNEEAGNNYNQDSHNSIRVRDAAKSVHDMDVIIYYHFRSHKPGERGK